MKNHLTPRIRVIRLQACLDIIGLSRSTLYSITSPKSATFDATFPKKVQIGVRAVGWYEDQIYQWLASRQDSTTSPPSIAD